MPYITYWFMSSESNVFFSFLHEEDSTEGTFSCICPVLSFLGTAVLFRTLGKALPLMKNMAEEVVCRLCQCLILMTSQR